MYKRVAPGEGLAHVTWGIFSGALCHPWGTGVSAFVVLASAAVWQVRCVETSRQTHISQHKSSGKHLWQRQTEQGLP